MTSSIDLGTLTLQPGRQLLAGGVPLPVGRKPLDILTTLAAARGDLVTKGELMEAVWPGMIVEENALQAHIVALRKLLGGEAQRLKTVRGLGYRLVLADEARHAPAPDEAPAVAVLPFVNLSDDPEMDYLGDGIAEEIICSLARTRSLRVPARTSTFAYKGRNRDIRGIARELGVGFVLEGSVRTGGGRIRLTAQLIEAEGGFHLWSENYDCQPDDLIAIQESIARTIAGKLESELLVRPATGDPAAFDLHLRARSLMDRGSPDNLTRAIDLFRQAVALDPDYADARAGLSRALVYACSRGALSLEGYDDALAQARAACALDPRNAGAQAVAGCGLARHGNWLEGYDYLNRAIMLHEEDADLHCVFGSGFLLSAGHIDAANRHALRARALAPASAIAHLVAAITTHFAGNHERAEEHLADALEFGFPDGVQPIPAMRASSALARGDRPEAARLAAQCWRDMVGEEEPEIVSAAYLGIASARGPAIDRFRALLARAGQESWGLRHDSTLPHLLTRALLLEEPELVRGTADLALAAFRQCGILEIHAFVPLWSRNHAAWLDDPHLRDVFAQLGLQAYWDVHGPPEFATAAAVVA